MTECQVFERSNQSAEMSNLPLLIGLILGGFFFIVTLIIGLILLIESLSRKKAIVSQNWPSVTGKISLSEVRQSASTDDSGESNYAYYPNIEYTYTALGKDYTARQISTGGVKGTVHPFDAQNIVDQFPVNALVQVYYNPQNPAEAVLEQEVSPGLKTIRVLGIVLLAVSAVIAVLLVVGLIAYL